MKLSGIQIKNYRSIGQTGVLLSPLRKCNIIIGKNNVGKSNIVRFLKHFNTNFRGQAQVSYKSNIGIIDRFGQKNDARLEFSLEFSTDILQEINLRTPEIVCFAFREAIDSNDITMNSMQFRQGQDLLILNEMLQKMGRRALSNTSSQNLESVKENMKGDFYLRFYRPKLSHIRLIPEFRRMTYSEVDERELQYDESGTDMIKRLARAKNPAPGNPRDKFLTIEKFVKQLLDMPEISLSISEQPPRQIVLQRGSQTLGLESYGTGAHEVILMVTAIVLSSNDTMWCIEEPEIHLHPSLQRKLIEFLITETDNQYIITTHSPTLINMANELPTQYHDEIQIFHIEKVDGETISHTVLNDTDSLTAIADLGFRASDILQTNCVIWVEGPSDRIYLKHWLNLIAPDLREGFHFSIMLYGGSLGSHLSVDRDYPEEFIDILHINQNTIVFMDSDKGSSDTELSAYKQRIIEECEKDGDNLAWVSDGRETENYIPENVISNFLTDHRGIDIKIKFSTYDRLEKRIEATLKKNGVQSFNYANDKVGYAKKIIKYITADDIPSDLNNWLTQIIERILKWNHITK